jgi:TIR domain/NUDIX domain
MCDRVALADIIGSWRLPQGQVQWLRTIRSIPLGGPMHPAPEAPIGFLSYAHFPNPQEQAKLDALRERLETEVYNQTGDPFRIFQDRRDIQWGEAWQRRIESSIDNAAFLIPVLTPSFFRSPHCRAELARFIRRERELDTDDLIRPIYYINCPELDDDTRINGDPLLKEIAARQYIDFRKLRFANQHSASYARKVAEIAEMLTHAIRTSRESDRSGDAPESSRIAEEPSSTKSAEPNTALISSAAGLSGVFQNWSHCQDEILRELTTSISMRVFAQIGQSILSRSALIFNALEHPRSDSRIKILHAGLTNPYVGERSALLRGADYREWREDIEYIQRVGARLKARLGNQIEIRQHNEGYIWRLFIFDDFAYVQPYIYESDNAQQAPVFKFSRLKAPDGVSSNSSSLYNTFARYFDLRWEECAARPSSLDEMIREGQRAVVVALAQDSGRRLFVIHQKLLDSQERTLEFNYIGGKRARSESWADALQREAREEIGSELIVKSSSYTRDLTSEAEFEPLHLTDAPRPYFLYRRTRAGSTEERKDDVLWIIGYEAGVPVGALLAPSNEIAALVTMSPELLRRTGRESITYDEIARAEDGSSVIVRPDIAFDYDRVAKPAHLASLSVKIW